MSDNNVDNTKEDAKIAAFQSLVARHYVPTFVEKLASNGLQLEDEVELAHALQLNGKFAAVMGDGASLDTLVDAMTAQLNIKAASEGDNAKLSIGTINHALDTVIKSAGIELNDSISASTADGVYSPSDEDLAALQAIAG